MDRRNFFGTTGGGLGGSRWLDFWQKTECWQRQWLAEPDLNV